jgi:hypothetical protein
MLKNYNFFTHNIQIFEDAPSIPIKEKSWKKKGKTKDKVAIYFHDDLDGVYSGVVMKNYLEGKGFKIKKYGIVNYQESWNTTKLDPSYINIALDFAEDVKGIDIFMDHHGEFELGENIGKTSTKFSTGSAYEGICQQLGLPVDSLVVNVIDMVDSAKYDDYGVDIKGILDFDPKKFKTKLDFAGAFNQMLKRSDHKTFIEVVSNTTDKSPSIYKIYNLFKALYPYNNLDSRKVNTYIKSKYFHTENEKIKLKLKEIKDGSEDSPDEKKEKSAILRQIFKDKIEDKKKELLKTKDGREELSSYMKDFEMDAKYRLGEMESRTRGIKGPSQGKKDYITSQDEFIEKFGSNVTEWDESGEIPKEFDRNDPQVKIPGYQILGNMLFIPSGAWANALRGRAIWETDILSKIENEEIVPDIEYNIEKSSPIYDELIGLIENEENDDEDLKVELVGDLINTNDKLVKNFNVTENITDMDSVEGVSGTLTLKGDKLVLIGKGIILWIMLQYGNTLQVASLHKLDKYYKKYLPKTKDNQIIDHLGNYTTSLVSKFEKTFDYDKELIGEKPTTAGGHPGIGTVSNIFGVVGEKKDSNKLHGKVKEYQGVRFLDLYKNKMVQDLSGIPWENLKMRWNTPTESPINVKETEYDKKTMYLKDIRKVNQQTFEIEYPDDK